jgi:hypothetical protein
VVGRWAVREHNIKEGRQTLESNSTGGFDHALNDDMIRLGQLDMGLSRLRLMQYDEVPVVAALEHSILSEMEHLRQRIVIRAKALKMILEHNLYSH